MASQTMDASPSLPRGRERLWECASPPIEDARVEFRAAEIEFIEDGALFVDDVFLCPVAPLIAAARSETAE